MKESRIYYYYHEESDSLFSMFRPLDWSTENPDGCIIPVTRKRAMQIKEDQMERYIQNADEINC